MRVVLALYCGCTYSQHCVYGFAQTAMKVVDFSTEEIRDIFKLLSGTLHLGNVEFMTAGGAQITTKAGK